MNIRVTFPPKKEKYIEPFMIQLVFLSLNLQSTKVVSNSVSHFLQPLIPERWNSQAGKVNGNKEEVKSLNSYLNSLKEKVHEVHRHLIDRNMPVIYLSVVHSQTMATYLEIILIQDFNVTMIHGW